MPLLDLPYHSGPREILGPHVYLKGKEIKILIKITQNLYMMFIIC
jgi:hypothetical protein